jgi:ATP-binding cassette subfamily B protein
MESMINFLQNNQCQLVDWLVQGLMGQLNAEKTTETAPTEDIELLYLLKRMEAHRKELIEAIAYEDLSILLYIGRIIAIGGASESILSPKSTDLFGVDVGAVGKAITLSSIAVLASATSAYSRHKGQVIWSGLSRDVQKQLRLELYEHVQNLEILYLDSKDKGELLSFLNEDIHEIERAFDALWKLLHIGTMTTLGFGWLLSISPLLAGLTALPIPVLIASAFYHQPQIRDAHAEIRQQASALSSQITNNLEGIATIKSYLTETCEARKIEAASNLYANKSKEAVQVSSLFQNIIQGSIWIGLVPTSVLVAVLSASKKASPGLFISSSNLMGTLLYNFEGLAAALDDLERGLVSHHRIRNLLSIPRERDGGQTLLQKFPEDIVYESVSFGYGAGRQVLHDISLRFAAGSTTAIVGLSGAGKSTLFNLLLNFYEPNSGRILIGNQDISKVDRKDLRRHIAVVAQDPFLFQGSVYENVALGAKISREQVINACMLAQAHDFITMLPNGYDTIVGGSGQGLSRGQLQRLAIARAIAKDAPIIILDEATSSLDANTEADVQMDLTSCFSGRTVILIAHRLSTVRFADHIYVLENGRILEEGNHDSLLTQGGRYASFWWRQVGV